MTSQSVQAFCRTAFTHGCHGEDGHEHISHLTLSRRLARVLGFEFGGDIETALPHRSCYIVPRRSLSGSEKLAHGITAESDLFGGWTSEPYMSSKAIMHPLLSREAAAPQDWPHDLAREASSITLTGFTAFTAQDALAAGSALLNEHGASRLKPATADGGRCQIIVSHIRELERALASLGSEAMVSGLVLEENLAEVKTYSVGQVRVPGQTISYCGTQALTRDNTGCSAYGGSHLFIVRGDYDVLLAKIAEGEIRQAVSSAVEFDRLADRHVPDLIASRRNYDVARGMAANGSIRLGVLEQSWRVGGASGAEIVALEAFANDPSLTAVRASTVEAYGEGKTPPGGALVTFNGDDPVVGKLLKYACVEDRIAG